MPERLPSPTPIAPAENPFLPDLRRVEVTPAQKREAIEERAEERLQAILPSSSREFVEAEAKRLGVSKEDLLELVKKEVGKELSQGFTYRADSTAKQWGLKPMEMKPLVLDAVVSRLEFGDPHTAIEIAQGVLSQKDLQSERIRHAASGGVIHALERGSLGVAKVLQQSFGLKEGIFSTQSARKAMEAGITHAFLLSDYERNQDSQYGDAFVADGPRDALEIARGLGFSDKDELKVSQQSALKAIEHPSVWSLGRLSVIHRSSPLPAEFFLRKEVIEGLQDVFASALLYIGSNDDEGTSEAVEAAATEWPLPRSFFLSHPIQEAVKKLILEKVKAREGVISMRPLLEAIEVPTEDLKRYVAEAVEHESKELGDLMEYEIRLLENFSVPFEGLSFELKGKIKENLPASSLADMNQFLKACAVPGDTSQELIQQKLNDFGKAVPDQPSLMALVDLMKRLNLPRDAFQRFSNDALSKEFERELARGSAVDVFEMSRVIKFFVTSEVEGREIGVRLVKVSLLSYDYVSQARSIGDYFKLPKKIVEDMVYQAALDLLRSADRRGIDLFLSLKNHDALREKEEVQEAGIEGLRRDLLQMNGADVGRLIETLHFPKERVKSEVINVVDHFFFKFEFAKAKNLVDVFQVNRADLKASLERVILSSLEKGRIDNFLEIIELFDESGQMRESRLVRGSVQFQLPVLLIGQHYEQAQKLIELLKISKTEVTQIAKRTVLVLLQSGKSEQALFVNEMLKVEDLALKQCHLVFGSFVSVEAYELVEALQSKKPLSEKQEALLTELGVLTEGRDALSDLEKRFREFRQGILQPEGINAEKLGSSSLLRAYTKAMVRFDVSQWGQHDDAVFLSTAKKYLEKKNELRPLPEELVPSEVLRIKTIDEAKQDAYQPTEDATQRLLTFKESIEKAMLLKGDIDKLQGLFQEMRNKRDHLILGLEEKLTDQSMGELRRKFAEEQEKRSANTGKVLSHEQQQQHIDQQLVKAKQAIQRRIIELHSVDFDQLAAPQRMFSVLASHGEVFAQELRALVFWASLNLRPGQEATVAEHLEEIGNGQLGVEAFSWAVDFIDHITNKEVMRRYFTDKPAAEAFKKLLNVKALEDELSRAQNQQTKGTAPFQFVPGRNLLTEFSGHIADACWASKYPSMLEKLPNFSSMMIVSNPENPKTMRLAGASMLIETQAEDGTPLLVIRGLNPLQGIINHLQPKDFVDKVFAYLKPLASKMGRKLAIVIDGHSGGSGTNRPVLFAHLTARKVSMKPVRLGSAEDTTFNGYNITNVTYLVD